MSAQEWATLRKERESVARETFRNNELRVQLRGVREELAAAEARVEALSEALRLIEAMETPLDVEDTKHFQAHLYHRMRDIARAALAALPERQKQGMGPCADLERPGWEQAEQAVREFVDEDEAVDVLLTLRRLGFTPAALPVPETQP